MDHQLSENKLILMYIIREKENIRFHINGEIACTHRKEVLYEITFFNTCFSINHINV